jgi:citrate synthase
LGESCSGDAAPAPPAAAPRPPAPGGGGAARRGRRAEAAESGPSAAIAARHAEDRTIPGFGHPLYPEGDPRAAALVDRLSLSAELQALRTAVEAQTGLAANVDFALVALADTLGLPRDAPFALFAVARCAGWIAHALEQSQTDQLIRPRARYVGPVPG